MTSLHFSKPHPQHFITNFRKGCQTHTVELQVCRREPLEVQTFTLGPIPPRAVFSRPAGGLGWQGMLEKMAEDDGKYPLSFHFVLI